MSDIRRSGHVTLPVLLALLLAVVPSIAWAQDLRIAAASDLQTVFPLLVTRFEQASGRKVGVTFGSSGTFFSQIQNGAPFDLFFSADVAYAAELQSKGLVEPGTLHQYAQGRIVLWTRKDSGIDIRRGLAALADVRVVRIAIANPAHAPYGRAAVAAIRQAGLSDTVSPKLVFGESVSQAAQFVSSGNATAGIIALSLAISPALQSIGTYLEIPPSSHPPIDQAVIMTRASRQKDLAHRFLAFMAEPETIRALRSFGFVTP